MLCFAILVWILVPGLSSAAVNVNLPDGGVVIGHTTQYSINNTKYYAFQGIPYAKPPVGKLRFQVTQPYGPLQGMFNAHAEGPACPQMDIINDVVIGEEDCLKINIFTPQEPQNSTKFPVVVFIHEGDFQRGSSSSEEYDFTSFLDQKTLVVTFNYRLGTLGFLSITSETVGGNFGLMDQVEALKWVQRNIRAFGGDPEHVTLFGSESGAVSALIHLLTPLSKGLFHKIIALSGSPLCENSIQTNQFHWATKLGHALDCFVNDPKIFLNCLRKRTPQELVTEAHKLHKLAKRFPVVFLPVFYEGKFLSESPINLMINKKINKVPVMLSTSDYVGQNIFKGIFEEKPKNKNSFFETILPSILKFITQTKNPKELSKIIENKYSQLNVNFDDEKQFENFTIQILNDHFINNCVQKTANLLTQSDCPVFMFKSSYETTYHDELDFLRKTTQNLSKSRSMIYEIWNTFIHKDLSSQNSKSAIHYVNVTRSKSMTRDEKFEDILSLKQQIYPQATNKRDINEL